MLHAKAMITVQAVPILSDNYAWLLRCAVTGATAIVDPADPAPVAAAIDAAGGRLDLILLTHHHGDHVAGTDDIRARYNAPVIGAAADAHRLPKLDRGVREGDSVTLGQSSARVIDTPGHTRGHISFYSPMVLRITASLICADRCSAWAAAVAGGYGGRDVASLRKFALCHRKRWCAAGMNTPKAMPASPCMSITAMPLCNLRDGVRKKRAQGCRGPKPAIRRVGGQSVPARAGCRDPGRSRAQKDSF